MCLDYQQGYALGQEHGELWTQMPTAALLRHLATLLEQTASAETGWLAEASKRAWVVGVMEGIQDYALPEPAW